ncbi:Trihelix transcription factor GT-3b [Acorus gramineus]|uniref:Trihelix transcription factor GT-3b n=1 Tax=Acorus gramineus TaxID=55184 RepID=A0AAV9ADU6_ACOGR|nr:Trihelix transcription factor GT-3b [Acorus gramineus]
MMSGDDDDMGRMGLLSGLPMHMNPTGFAGEIGLPQAGAGAGPSSAQARREERVPQWGHQETRDFIAIRAELERDFKASKRNKTLWEGVSSKMKERGYRRSPDQCKCKWKNLVNRYKGKETSDPENGRHCPFFDELHAIFTERAKTMHRALLESETGGGPQSSSKKKLKRPSGEMSSDDDFSDEDDDGNDDGSDDDRTSKGAKKRKPQPNRTPSAKAGSGVAVHEVLHEFLQQQERMEQQWREAMERRAQERRMFEQEWRQSMERLERERLMLEQAWREREEQRRMREESRAEKRDALLTTLLNKLIQDGI